MPYIKGGAGPRKAVVFFGGNALFRRLDRSSRPARYVRQIGRLLPAGYTFYIQGETHMLPLERRRQLSRCLAAFLDR